MSVVVVFMRLKSNFLVFRIDAPDQLVLEQSSRS